MKTKNVVIFSGLIMMVLGCKNSQFTEAEFVKIRSERDSLLQASADKDSSINVFLTSFNEIESNLINIRQRQESLTLESKRNVESGGSVVDDVKENIRIINELMEQNQKKISSLNSIINSKDNKMQELNGMVNVLIQHVQDKNRELAILNTSLMEKNKELAQRNKVIFQIPK